MGLCENREGSHLPMMEMQMLFTTSPDWSLVMVGISFLVSSRRFWNGCTPDMAEALVARPVNALRSMATLEVHHDWTRCSGHVSDAIGSVLYPSWVYSCPIAVSIEAFPRM